MYFLFRFFYILASLKVLSKVWWIFYYLDFFRKKIVFKNLDIAFKEKSKEEKVKIAKETYKNFLIFFEDIIYFKKNPHKLEQIKIKNEKFLLDAINSNRPIILMTAHFGNWEISPKLILHKYKKPLAIVMREIDNPKINKFFKNIRSEKEHIKLINKKRSAKEILKALIKEKRVLGILIDQSTTNKNAPIIEFFIPTPFNPAISKLAKATGAVVIPGFCYKENNEYILEFKEYKIYENDSIESFTQWQAKVIENMIKKYPSQYYWFHDRWKNKNNP